MDEATRTYVRGLEVELAAALRGGRADKSEEISTELERVTGVRGVRAAPDPAPTAAPAPPSPAPAGRASGRRRRED